MTLKSHTHTLFGIFMLLENFTASKNGPKHNEVFVNKTFDEALLWLKVKLFLGSHCLLV